MNTLPHDPIMLLGAVNTLLRDEYDSLDSLCDDYDISREELVERLRAAGFEYIPSINQFR
ncbi:MAG: DUF4250 domain-containing protein [Muribaculaceae bacterium]